MLHELKAEYEKAFVEDFTKILGDKFDITCDWGFPVLSLEVSSKNPETKITWKFMIDVVKPDYILQTKGIQVEDEKEIPTWASIDRTTLEFIVNKSIQLSNKLLKDEETAEESVEEELS